MHSLKHRVFLITWLVLAAGFLLLLAAPRGVRAGTDAQAAADARHAYHEKIAAKYNYYQGKENPFLPSNVTTDNGEFMDPKSFPTAEYCGHCHKESHQQWRESAHSNSNRAPWYLKNVGLLNDEKGIQFSRHCEGCHDPIATVAGALDTGWPQKAALRSGRRHLLGLPQHQVGGHTRHRLLCSWDTRRPGGRERRTHSAASFRCGNPGPPGPPLESRDAAVLQDERVLRKLPQGRTAQNAERLQVAARDLTL